MNTPRRSKKDQDRRPPRRSDTDPAPPAPRPPDLEGELDLRALELDLSQVDLSREDMNALCRAAGELVRRIDQPDQLLEGMLSEYSERLAELGDVQLVPENAARWNPETRRRLSLLVLYSGLAVLLQDKARVFARLSENHREMERSSERLESALAESSEARGLLAGVLDALPVGVVVLDAAGEPWYANPVARGLMGLSGDDVPLGARVKEFFQLAVDPARPTELGDSDIEVLGPDDTLRRLHRVVRRLDLAVGEAPGCLMTIQDVTDEHALRDELLRSGRLTAILDTAAALNHEINNPLAAILGRAQMLLSRPGESTDRVVAGLKVIEESARRIADLAGQVKEITEPAFTEYSRGVMMLDIKGSQKRRTAA